MGKRTWDEINYDTLRAMEKLKPEERTLTNIHNKVGKFGIAHVDNGNTERLLHRMRVQGLVEVGDRLTWQPTPAGEQWLKQWVRWKEKGEWDGPHQQT